MALRTFRDCTGIAEIVIPSDLSIVGDNAFYNCSALLICPKESTAAVALSKKYYTFREEGSRYNLRYEYDSEWNDAGMLIANVDKDIVSLEIPTDVTVIAVGAMDGCTRLESVVLPDGLSTIYKQAFRNCSSLTSVDIPSEVTAIPDEAFYGCSALESITIPASVTAVGQKAFYGCRSLASVVLPDRITEIK